MSLDDRLFFGTCEVGDCIADACEGSEFRCTVVQFPGAEVLSSQGGARLQQPMPAPGRAPIECGK